MNFRNLTAEQRLSIGIAWLFLVHALLNLAVGLYRCHNVTPGLTDHLATVLPGAQTCLLVCWLFFGPASLSKRLAGFIGGHLQIFLVYSNFLLPDFETIRRRNNWQWSYFHYSGPGDWLAKVPVLLLGLGSVFLLVKIYRCWLSQPSDNEETQGLASTEDLDSVRQPLMQFDVADLLFWTIVCCLALSVYAAPAYTGWTIDVLQIWAGIYKFETIVDWCTIGVAVLWVLAFYLVLMTSPIERLSKRLAIQLGLVMIAGLVFDWQFRLMEGSKLMEGSIYDLPRQTFLAPSFVLVASSSLIVLEILADPNFGQAPKTKLKRIDAPGEGKEEEATDGEVPSIEI